MYICFFYRVLCVLISFFYVTIRVIISPKWLLNDSKIIQRTPNPPAVSEFAKASSLTAGVFLGGRHWKIFNFWLFFEPLRSHLGDIMTLIVT